MTTIHARQLTTIHTRQLTTIHTRQLQQYTQGILKYNIDVLKYIFLCFRTGVDDVFFLVGYDVITEHLVRNLLGKTNGFVLTGRIIKSLLEDGLINTTANLWEYTVLRTTDLETGTGAPQSRPLLSFQWRIADILLEWKYAWKRAADF